MKCKIPFAGKIKKNITNVSSAELAQRVIKVKILEQVCFWIEVSEHLRVIEVKL